MGAIPSPPPDPDWASPFYRRRNREIGAYGSRAKIPRATSQLNEDGPRRIKTSATPSVSRGAWVRRYSSVPSFIVSIRAACIVSRKCNVS
jgi:hypothetical protein